jgi:hypothetical protein
MGCHGDPRFCGNGTGQNGSGSERAQSRIFACFFTSVAEVGLPSQLLRPCADATPPAVEPPREFIRTRPAVHRARVAPAIYQARGASARPRSSRRGPLGRATPHPAWGQNTDTSPSIPTTHSRPLVRPTAGLRLWRIPFVASQAPQVPIRCGEGETRRRRAVRRIAARSRRLATSVDKIDADD